MKANVWEKLFYDGKNWFFSVDIMLINDIILNFLEKIQTLVTKFEYRDL